MGYCRVLHTDEIKQNTKTAEVDWLFYVEPYQFYVLETFEKFDKFFIDVDTIYNHTSIV